MTDHHTMAGPHERVGALERSRTVHWRDPAALTQLGAAMSGIDYLTAMKDGRLPAPPFGELLQIDIDDVARGRVAFTCVPDESMYNATGLIHGGIVCTLLDTVTACAVLSTLPAGTGLASAEIKVSYLRPVHPAGGPLTAVGTVLKTGSRLSYADGVATNVKGEIVASASSTLLIIAP
jgi:uncharacterized protein (TIGR00369 family)